MTINQNQYVEIIRRLEQLDQKISKLDRLLTYKTDRILDTQSYLLENINGVLDNFELVVRNHLLYKSRAELERSSQPNWPRTQPGSQLRKLLEKLDNEGDLNEK